MATFTTLIVSCFGVGVFLCKCAHSRVSNRPAVKCEMQNSNTIVCKIARNIAGHEVTIWSLASSNAVIGCCNSLKCTSKFTNEFNFVVTGNSFLLISTWSGLVNSDYRLCLANSKTGANYNFADVCANGVRNTISCSLPYASNETNTRNIISKGSEDSCSRGRKCDRSENINTESVGSITDIGITTRHFNTSYFLSENFATAPLRIISKLTALIGKTATPIFLSSEVPTTEKFSPENTKVGTFTTVPLFLLESYPTAEIRKNLTNPQAKTERYEPDRVADRNGNGSKDRIPDMSCGSYYCIKRDYATFILASLGAALLIVFVVKLMKFLVRKAYQTIQRQKFWQQTKLYNWTRRHLRQEDINMEIMASKEFSQTISPLCSDCVAVTTQTLHATDSSWNLRDLFVTPPPMFCESSASLVENTGIERDELDTSTTSQVALTGSPSSSSSSSSPREAQLHSDEDADGCLMLNLDSHETSENAQGLYHTIDDISGTNIIRESDVPYLCTDIGQGSFEMNDVSIDNSEFNQQHERECQECLLGAWHTYANSSGVTHCRLMPTPRVQHTYFHATIPCPYRFREREGKDFLGESGSFDEEYDEHFFQTGNQNHLYMNATL